MQYAVSKNTLVREGNAGVILPEYANIFDRQQEYPVDETQAWIYQLLSANRHITHPPQHYPIERGESLYVPTVQNLAFLAIRHSVDARSGVSIYDVSTSPRASGSELFSLLRITSGREFTVATDGQKVYSEGYKGQKKARKIVQPVVIGILHELGYGTPEEFAATAMPYRRYLKQHDIEKWPVPKTLPKVPKMTASKRGNAKRLH